jgi:hypothetical protein
MVPDGKKAKLMLELDEDGRIIDAKENGQPLEYGPGEDKRMDDGTASILRNPCRWVKINGQWYCI